MPATHTEPRVLIDNAPLRARFVEMRDHGLITAHELARLVGAYDATSAKQDLGLSPAKGRSRSRITESKALRYCDALLLDPIDVPGL